MEIAGTLALLIGLELVLGVDNVVVLAMLVSRLPKEQQNVTRNAGLALALVARLGLLAGASYLARMTDPVVFSFSIRDLLLLGGGLFLIAKAAMEIHHTVELVDDHQAASEKAVSRGSIIAQIVALDLVFSFDSVITAIGLTDQLWVIITAVVLSFVGVLAFAKPIGDFILGNPALKILALSFLVTIGVTLFLEGMGYEVPKGYIYLPMSFGLIVEMLQLRFAVNRKRQKQQAGQP